MGVNYQWLVENWYVVLVAAFLVFLSLAFVFRFVFPAFAIGRELNRVIRALKKIKVDAGGKVTQLDEIASKAMVSSVFTHLWSEYAETLHRQSEVGSDGQSRIVHWRATALADMFFSEQAIIDTRLKTEFYKHLPGILTGLGIIGTFFGLINGLEQFKVPEDLTKVQDQLGQLVATVGDAFKVSAIAITLAMLCTWAEKSLVAWLYRKVESLREHIDSLFDGGAGEEYLARLVTASETSATQAAHIKDALVADLKELLTSLAEKQIEAQARVSGQISSDVGSAIADALKRPMEAITGAVQGVSANQGEAVNKMLTDVLASFAAQMRDMFGGQMQDMSDLLRQTSESMKATALQFGQLAASMNAAGTGTVNAMGEKLNTALEAMEARQHAMNGQMGAFVEQIKAMVGESQTESSQKLKEVLTAVGDQVAGVVAELQRQAEESAQSHGQKQKRFEDAAATVMSSLSAQMEGLLTQSVETNKTLQGTVARLADATDKAMAGMNSGAETLYLAASDFAKAGAGVSDTMRESTAAVEAIKSASSQLALSTDGARSIVEDYGRTRDVFAAMVSDLKLTIENARREASMTSDIIGRIDTAATKLGIAQIESEKFLGGVSDILGKVHADFADNIGKTLRDGNSKFHVELTTAVGLVSGAIKDLGDHLEELPATRRQQ